MQMFYTVQRGDTVWQIARRWGIPFDSLIAANNLVAPYTILLGNRYLCHLELSVIGYRREIPFFVLLNLMAFLSRSS